jgi:MFS family permease
VAPLCWSTIALEGFDLVVLGVVIPSLLKEPSWGLNPGTTALIATVGLVGVMVGALTVGPITDLVGRRRAMIGTVVAFSVLTLACAFAPDPWTFGVLRFLAGIGLGGVLPVGLAMVNEHARDGRAGSATTTMMTGYHAGAVLASLLGILVIPALGWRPMFVIGAALAVLLLPALVLRLPESHVFEAERGKRRDNPVAVLFEPGYRRATLAFWLASIMGLLLVYGLNTWLPQIMIAAGYDLRNSLALLLVLNVGAVLGLLVAGQVANRIGTRTAALIWFVLAAVFLALLTVRLPGAGIYVTVLLAGVFTFSSQVLVYAYVGQRYPDSARATALGASSGVGRIGAIAGPLVTAPLLAAGIAFPWGFFVFAAVAAIGAAGVAAAGRSSS